MPETASVDLPSFRHDAVKKLNLWMEQMERFAAFSDFPNNRYRTSASAETDTTNMRSARFFNGIGALLPSGNRADHAHKSVCCANAPLFSAPVYRLPFEKLDRA
jgi:hypothetical protein